MPEPCWVSRPWGRLTSLTRPVWALDALATHADLYEQVRAALVEIEQRRGYEAGLEAALAACR